MSWISSAWNWLTSKTSAATRLLALLREKAPQVVPFLQALAVNDHQQAADTLLNSGTGREIMVRLPRDVQDYVRLSAPHICAMLDGLIPEENILSILEGVGVEVTPDEEKTEPEGDSNPTPATAAEEPVAEAGAKTDVTPRTVEQAAEGSGSPATTGEPGVGAAPQAVPRDETGEVLAEHRVPITEPPAEGAAPTAAESQPAKPPDGTPG